MSRPSNTNNLSWTWTPDDVQYLYDLLPICHARNSRGRSYVQVATEQLTLVWGVYPLCNCSGTDCGDPLVLCSGMCLSVASPAHKSPKQV